VQWEPPGLNGKVGEYLIGTPEGQNVFVEVKGPGWESQLSDTERQAGRAKRPKYQHLEGGPLANWEPGQKCISRAYPKFAPTQPNLLIIADDLKVPLHESLEQVEIGLYVDHERYGERGCFTSAEFEDLGGLGIFRSVSLPSLAESIEYEFKLFDNPFALPIVGLPGSLLKLKTKFAAPCAALRLPPLLPSTRNPSSEKAALPAITTRVIRLECADAEP
jgi:hypothetical protein